MSEQTQEERLANMWDQAPEYKGHKILWASIRRGFTPHYATILTPAGRVIFTRNQATKTEATQAARDLIEKEIKNG